MEFHTWEPVYRRILADFGYDRAGDERARDRLAELYLEATGGTDSAAEALRCLDFAGQSVAIAGAAPSLADELDAVEDADAVVAASDAARVVRRAGHEVDCMVTDLDGAPRTARELAARGVPVVVHAHGDNRPALESHVPELRADAVVPTTQASPAGPVRNFGGFTDGDRAAFLADATGAGRLAFPGWEFDDDSVSAEKAEKLAWAERLLHWLERRRDERFPVLDGRRGALDGELPG